MVKARRCARPSVVAVAIAKTCFKSTSKKDKLCYRKKQLSVSSNNRRARYLFYRSRNCCYGCQPYSRNNCDGLIVGRRQNLFLPSSSPAPLLPHAKRLALEWGYPLGLLPLLSYLGGKWAGRTLIQALAI